MERTFPEMSSCWPAFLRGGWNRWLYPFAAVVLATAACQHDESMLLVLCGDSTMAEYAVSGDKRGWGQELQDRLSDDVTVANRAKYGATAETYRRDVWPGALRLGPRWVLLQFGHNGNSVAAESVALMGMINEARASGARPILVTQMVARSRKVPSQSLADLSRSLSASSCVPLIPLDSLTLALWVGLDADFMSTRFVDNVHLTERGAQDVARLVAQQLRMILARKEDVTCH